MDNESGVRYKLLHQLHWQTLILPECFDAFLNGRYTLCLSSEILLEYEETFLRFWGAEVTAGVLGTLLTASNTSLHAIFFNFLLVYGDADDNKFADTYLASNADYLISNDAKLLALRRIDFPPVHVISLQEFSSLLAEQST